MPPIATMQPYEGVHTNASWPAIWVICAVALICLAALLFAVVFADMHPRVAPGGQPAQLPGPVTGGTHIAAGGRSVAPSRESSAAPGEDFLTDLAAARPGGAPDESGASADSGGPDT
jgi:hypothetical protein